MFEIGKPIGSVGFRHGNYSGASASRLNLLQKIFVIVFAVFAAKTILLGLDGVHKRDSISGVQFAERAEIYDRNGELLAKNIVSGHIQLRPVAVENPDAVAQLVHKAMPEYSVNDVLKMIEDGGFKYLKKFANDEQRKLISDAKLPGLEVAKTNMRHYPKGRRFSHVVGFVNNENSGLEGAELVFDDYLKQNKDPLFLSIDARIQEQFYSGLSAAMQEYQAKSAMGMLMNSRTGEIIAMVSLPDFNPENRALDPVSNRRFRPMRDLYEIGSIFKVFNTAMAYENGIAKKYYVKEPYKIYDARGRVAHIVHDVRSFKPTSPNLTVDEIMIQSCNVGSAQIALDLPSFAQREFFERLHFDKALDLEFGKTERGLMPRKWGPVERATVSFGHGISVTLMHALLAVNAMTNGGIYIYPTLKKREVGRIVGERVLSENISAKIRDNMAHVATDSSGKSAQSRVSGINIGGKTGTAEKRFANGKTDASRNLTTFISVFPIEAPQYISIVTLDEPQYAKGQYWKTAAWNAGPTTGKILDGIVPLLFE